MPDLIRRSDVIGLLEDMLLFGEYDIIASSFSKADEEKAYRAINDIPTVNRWIPCSERMPTMNEMRQSDCVLVFALDENWIGMAYYIGDGWAFADAQTKPRLETVEITHWMPLPEPPKEDEEDADN